MNKICPKHDGDWETLPSWMTIVDCYWVYYREGNPNNKKYHIRGFVDDRAVVRSWSKFKQQWLYEIKDPIYFTIDTDNILIGKLK